MQLGALRAALTAKLRDGAIKIVKDFELPSHKTVEIGKALSALEAGPKVLLVDDDPENSNLALSSRNIPGVTLIETAELHPYDLLGHQTIIFSQATVEHCNQAFAVAPSRRGQAAADDQEGAA
jgi:large subunit ribosomal protein L4